MELWDDDSPSMHSFACVYVFVFPFTADDADVMLPRDDEDDPQYSGDEGGSSKPKNKRKRGGGSSGAPTSTAVVTGIEFNKLLELCMSKLLVGSDTALRTHLVELKVWDGGGCVTALQCSDSTIFA